MCHHAALAVIASFAATQALAFDYFEHRAIGDAAYRALRLPPPDSLAGSAFRAATLQLFGRDAPGARSRRALTFGDLTALAGDHAGSKDELLKLIEAGDTSGTARVWPNTFDVTSRHTDAACRWGYTIHGDPLTLAADRLGDCFAELAKGDPQAARLAPYAREGYRPPRDERAAFEQLPNYVDLARKNQLHFPTYSWHAYVKHHDRALEAARCAAADKPCDGGDLSPGQRFAEALLHEAMAQHFLQDSYASGHVGTEFGGCNLGFLCDPPKVLTLHTHDALNRLGLDVRLQRPPTFLKLGDGPLRWTSFGDRSFFVPEAAFHRYVTTTTAAQSLQEVVNALGAVATKPGLLHSGDHFPVPDGKDLPSEQVDRMDELARRYTDRHMESLTRFDSRTDLAQTFKRSYDNRVPDMPVEGLKLSIGVGNIQSRNGAHLWPYFKSRQGLNLRLDYQRSTGSRLPVWSGVALPNLFGFDYADVPQAGVSWGLAAGWSLPRVVAPISANWKLRASQLIRPQAVLDADVRLRRSTWHLSLLSVEVAYEIFPPIAVFLQTDALSYDFGERRWVAWGRRGSRASFGVRIDLAAID